MKKILTALLWLAILGTSLLVFPSTVSAKSWEIVSWESAITISPDSSILVRETQTFVFEGDFSFVTRTLPKTKGIVYSDIRVFDDSGAELTGSAVDVTGSGDDVIIKLNFSASNTTKTWTFEYRAWNAIGFFDDDDELYWNAVSIEREVPIRSVLVRVRLPSDEIKLNDTRQRLLVGPVGSTTESTDYSVSLDPLQLVYRGSDIRSNESFTIVAGWPKGYVTEQTYSAPQTFFGWLWSWFQYVYFLSPVALFVLLLRRWRRHGRDPQGRGTIVPQYEPPDKVRPAVMGVLLNEKAKMQDITATIIDLAVRGYLRIRETEKPGFFKSKHSYTLERRNQPKKGDVQSLFERELLDKLFDGSSEVGLDDLKNKFYKNVSTLNKILYNEATSIGYFDRNPESVRTSYLTLGAVLAFAGFFLLFVPTAWGVMIILFGLTMPRRSHKGVAALEWAQGFKLYLHTAERFRLQDQKPELFDAFLPYAMIFGVEKEWASRFDDIYKQPPEWYSGATSRAFLLSSFASDFNTGFNQSLASTLASSPSSSSGFGGGGFSGGGGGSGAG
ncbi:MAG: DUF2207 domain-containing protein [Candidatus Kerfeldbacteria bacterium]|nr:DUF2207 domain-containing protein [Candidatus Kerfeldbacteria bacterium]